ETQVRIFNRSNHAETIGHLRDAEKARSEAPNESPRRNNHDERPGRATSPLRCAPAPKRQRPDTPFLAIGIEWAGHPELVTFLKLVAESKAGADGVETEPMVKVPPASPSLPLFSVL